MTDKIVSAGNVCCSPTVYVVVDTHKHRTLALGDRVVMTEDPQYRNLLIRLSDYTLHALEDEYDQYVHLSKEGSDS